jgi:hypothetical protein
MASLNYKWVVTAQFCDQRNIKMEDLLYSRDRRTAAIRREFWNLVYRNGAADQKTIAEMFNVSQQAVSKVVKGIRNT